MPKKDSAKLEDVTESVENDVTEQSIDPQKQYLMDQFGNLMEQVGDGFGGPLQEELIKRLEQTVADFHEEVSEMIENLKDNAEKRHETLKEIWNNPDASTEAISDGSVSEPSAQPATSNDDSEMSEWERKLEAAGKLGDTQKPEKEEPKEEKPKKKGFFGRKKK